MKRLLLVICLLGVSVIWGCGGAGSPPSTAPGGQGQLSFTVKWPLLRTQLIPADSSSIVAVLTDANSNVLASQVLTRPAGNSTTVSFPGLQPGQVTLTATAYPTTTGTGVPQATGSAGATIVAGQTAQVTVTMADTIVRVVITPANPSVAPNGTQQLTMTAYDAKSEIVLTSPTTTKWSSGTPATATVSSAGLLTAVMAGNSLITVTETESGKSGTTTVTVPPAVQSTNVPYYTYGDINGKYLYCNCYTTTRGGTNNIDQYSLGANGALTPLSPAFISLPTGYSFTVNGPGREIWVDPAGNYIYALITSFTFGGNYLLPLKIGSTGALTALAPVTLTAGECIFGDPAGKYVYTGDNQVGIQQFTINANGSLTNEGVNTNVFAQQATIAPNGTFGIASTNGGSLGTYAFSVGSGGALAIVNSIGVGAGKYHFSADSGTVYCNQGTSIVRSAITFSGGTYHGSNQPTIVYQEAINGFGTDSVYAGNGIEVFLRDLAVDNSVDPYLLNPTGSMFTPITPVGSVPNATNYSLERNYDYATPNSKFVYNPNPVSASISEFAVGSAGGLTPLSPATVPTQ